MSYTITGMVTISISTIVEANSEEEAILIAKDRSMCSLIDPERTGDSLDEAWCHSGEIDGTAFELEVEK